MRNIPVARPSVGNAEWQALARPISTGWLTQGPVVAEFEQAFALRHGVRHAIAVTSCTTGLHLALSAMGVGPGDEVIVPAFTWIATANAVVHCGARPVVVDIDPATYNMNAELAIAAITARTKAVVPVHLFGLCFDVATLRERLPDRIGILEDAACAAGAAYGGRPAGALGCAGVFSFHPRKIITTGEGGMVTCDDDELAQRMRIWRNHGADENLAVESGPHAMAQFVAPGFNYRMTDLQAAVGLVQLARLDDMISERARLVAQYRQKLSSLGWLRFPSIAPEAHMSWQALVVSVDRQRAPASRNEIMQILKEHGVATRPGTHALCDLAIYRDRFGVRPDDLPCAAAAAADTITLPLFDGLADNDLDYVVATLCAIGA